nr:hypothetical protein StreXyl84_73270 [Streptomyces sp. Xyl84]
MPLTVMVGSTGRSASITAPASRPLETRVTTVYATPAVNARAPAHSRSGRTLLTSSRRDVTRTSRQPSARIPVRSRVSTLESGGGPE